jgi:hypothetical protein
MEPFIPLIKAIIISGLYVNLVTTVSITDRYIINVGRNESEAGIKGLIPFQIYDLEKDIILLKLNTTSKWDTIKAPMHWPIEIQGGKKIISTKMHTESFQGYKCRVVEKEMERYSSTEGSVKYKEVSYYAKIPKLDSALNTIVKKNMAGFWESPDERFPYLISRYTETEGGSTKNEVLRIVEDTYIDPSLLEDLIKGKIEK